MRYHVTVNRHGYLAAEICAPLLQRVIKFLPYPEQAVL
jgi:hypothetical protein